MREELVKSVIRYKLSMASKLLDRLPPEASGRIKTMGRLVFDTVVDFQAGTKESTAKSGSVIIE